jgi:hypothetical protein
MALSSIYKYIGPINSKLIFGNKTGDINNTKINDIITGSCYLGYYVRTVI